MARRYKIDDGEPINGEKLIETALNLFNLDESNRLGLGNCAHPRTVLKAQWFLTTKHNKKIYTKKDAETKWSLME